MADADVSQALVPMPTVALLPPPPSARPEIAERTERMEEIDHLNTLLAIFKNMNMELVREVSKLRMESENLKQQNMLLHYTSKDPDRMAGILREMTELSLGNRPSPYTGKGGAGSTVDIIPSLESDIGHCGRVFAAHLDSVGGLPGSTHALAQVGTENELPCVFSQ